MLRDILCRGESPDEFLTNHGCLGLRLRMPNGQEVITTTTHAFVKCVSSSSAMKLRVSEWYLSVRSALASFSPIRNNFGAPAIGESRQRGVNNSLKTIVWLAGIDRKIIDYRCNTV